MSTLVEQSGDEIRVTPAGTDIVSVFRPGVVGYERWRAIADGSLVERPVVAVMTQYLDDLGPCDTQGCTGRAVVSFDPPANAAWQRQQFCNDHTQERLREINKDDTG